MCGLVGVLSARASIPPERIGWQRHKPRPWEGEAIPGDIGPFDPELRQTPEVPTSQQPGKQGLPLLGFRQGAGAGICLGRGPSRRRARIRRPRAETHPRPADRRPGPSPGDTATRVRCPWTWLGRVPVTPPAAGPLATGDCRERRRPSQQAASMRHRPRWVRCALGASRHLSALLHKLSPSAGPRDRTQVEPSFEPLPPAPVRLARASLSAGPGLGKGVRANLSRQSRRQGVTLHVLQRGRTRHQCPHQTDASASASSAAGSAGWRWPSSASASACPTRSSNDARSPAAG